MTKDKTGIPSKNLGPLISEANNITIKETLHSKTALCDGVPFTGNQGIKNKTKRQENAPSLNGILIFVKITTKKWLKTPKVQRIGTTNQRLKSILPLSTVEAKIGQNNKAT